MGIGIVLFALAILVSVSLHEAGHMVTAKMFGMKVTKYFVGFGPTLWSFRKGETEYGVKGIPLGGYVKIVGMTPQDDDVEPGDEARAMWRFPVWKRTIVMAAGSVMHFILALVIIYGVVVISGRPNPAASADVQPATVTILPCVVVANDNRDCVPGSDPYSPAKAAGLQNGDKIISLSGKPTNTYNDLVKAIRSAPAGPTQLEYVRDGVTSTATVNLIAVQRAPVSDPSGKVGTTSALGVTWLPPADVPTTLAVGPVQGIGVTGGYMRDLVVGVGQSLSKFPEKIPKLWTAITGGQRDQETPISVVGASRIGGETVQHGQWAGFFLILASLNLFVGLFNLLPLLPLDGGHIAIAWFEKARSWFYRRIGRRDPGRVDYMKLMPITYVVILLFGGLTLLTVAADIVNPITLFGK
jgi:membrane-associated protease RseP (regulator of RpoE activity)